MRAAVVVPVLAGLLLIDAAVWTWWQTGTDVGYERCLGDAVDCAGERHVLPLQRVYAVEGSTADIGRPEGRVRVRGDLAGVVAGDEVTLIGTFDEAGWLVVDTVEGHPLRPLKRRLGVYGAALVALLLPLAFTVRRWRLVPRRSRRG